MRTYGVQIATLSAALVACAPADRDGFDLESTGSSGGSGPGGTSGPGDGDGDGDGDSGDAGGASTRGESDSGDDSDSGDGGGIRLDVGGGGTEGAGDGGAACDPMAEDCSCTGVDVVFVIDNSSSMRDNQEALAAAAPGFADALIDNLRPGTDLHVGVTTTSFAPPGTPGTSPGESACSPYYAGAGLNGRDDFYDFYFTPDMPFPENGAQGRLRTHEARTYFELEVGQDPAAMKDWLVGNITGVGTQGSPWEMITAGAAYPFHPGNAADNAGFLRDDGAVLVLFVLSDAVGHSPEDVAAYHDMVVAAKQQCGGDRCVVTGGVIQSCLTTVTGDTRIYPFLESFGKTPVVADIGAGPDVFVDALGDTLAQVIGQTCEEIGPPVG